jgi:hypothetical protein
MIAAGVALFAALAWLRSHGRGLEEGIAIFGPSLDSDGLPVRRNGAVVFDRWLDSMGPHCNAGDLLRALDDRIRQGSVPRHSDFPELADPVRLCLKLQ